MQKIDHNENGHSPVEATAATATGDSSLRKTGRHISKRTTDLIAISIVGIGVLTVSGRLAEWWQTDPTSVASPTASALQTAGSPVRWGVEESNVRILAGDQAVQMDRKVIYGDQDRVDSILLARLVRTLETEESHTRPASDEKFAAQEQRLLGLLRTLTPIENREGRGKIYRLDRADNPLPGSFLIATRPAVAPSGLESLAGWAIATPSGPQQWTTFLLTPTGAVGETSQPATPVPEDGNLLISLRTDKHDELTVFQRLDASLSDVSRWARGINNQLTETGWHETRSWQQSASSASARFERSADPKHHPHQAMELTISFAESGQLTGTSNVIVIPDLELLPFDAPHVQAP